jgi:hypothetical protein
MHPRYLAAFAERTRGKLDWAYSYQVLPLQYFVTALRVTSYLADLKTLAPWLRNSGRGLATRGDRADVPADRNVNRDFYLHPIHCHNVDMS